MQQIAMIHDMKLDVGLDAYKRGMSSEEIETSNRWEFEEKMKWIDAERRVEKWLKLRNITGEDEEDFLRRYHAKYGEKQESRTNHESTSSSSLPTPAMSDMVGQEQRDEAISAACWDLLERVESRQKQPWQ